MVATRISLDSAKAEKLFYFVANVVIYREGDGRCLILKRDARERVHPGKYAVPGGKLEWKDLDPKSPTRVNGEVLDFQDAAERLLQREAAEEAGVAIDDRLVYINSVAFIRPDGVPVMLVKFAARYRSGEVRPEKGGFTDYAWVNGSEAAGYDCIEGVREEVAQAIRAFSG